MFSVENHSFLVGSLLFCVTKNSRIRGFVKPSMGRE
jgi:hypothetical protein